MSVADQLRELGGVATRATLLRLAPRADVDRALAGGAIVADARGRYALPETDTALRRAHTLTGVLSHTSAALWHGWEVKVVPREPHVLVPRRRRVPAERRRGVQLHRADLDPGDVDGPATSVELTLLHCLRSLPYDEGLAVADSALRHGVAPATLQRVALTAASPGSPRVRRIAAAARPEAANPFESVLMAITHEVEGIHVEPQVLIRSGGWVRPDLVDRDLGIVLEADSFQWHGGRAALCRDARRYNQLVADGWVVLRFSWEDVMHHPDQVREVLREVVRLVLARTQVRRCDCRSA